MKAVVPRLRLSLAGWQAGEGGQHLLGGERRLVLRDELGIRLVEKAHELTDGGAAAVSERAPLPGNAERLAGRAADEELDRATCEFGQPRSRQLADVGAEARRSPRRMIQIERGEARRVEVNPD